MKNKYNILISDLFLKISQEIVKFSDEDIRNLLEGKADIILQIKTKKQDTKDNLNFETIDQELSKMSSREDGFDYLKKKNFKRSKLILFANFLDITIKRTDKNEQIMDKIIEAIIGYRLRSEAIQKA